MTQTDEIRRYLERGRALTAGSALRLIGTMRLAARIHQLKRDGMQIKREFVRLSSGKRVASYSMA